MGCGSSRVDIGTAPGAAEVASVSEPPHSVLMSQTFSSERINLDGSAKTTVLQGTGVKRAGSPILLAASRTASTCASEAASRSSIVQSAPTQESPKHTWIAETLWVAKAAGSSYSVASDRTPPCSMQFRSRSMSGMSPAATDSCAGSPVRPQYNRARTSSEPLPVLALADDFVVPRRRSLSQCEVVCEADDDDDLEFEADTSDATVTLSAPVCTWEQFLNQEAPHSPFGWFSPEHNPSHKRRQSKDVRSRGSSMHHDDWAHPVFDLTKGRPASPRVSSLSPAVEHPGFWPQPSPK